MLKSGGDPTLRAASLISGSLAHIRAASLALRFASYALRAASAEIPRGCPNVLDEAARM